jgi:hypothetical protein
MDDLGAFGRPFAVAGEHDMAAARQQAGQALEGLAAHDHRHALRVRDEALQVFLDPPRHVAVLGDRAVVGAGDDEHHLAPLAHHPSLVTCPILRPSRASLLP